MIDGLQYLSDYIDRHEHDHLLERVDRHPWLKAVDHDVQIYGYRYDKKSESAFKIGEMPKWIVPLATRLHADGLIAHIPNQLVVNGYPPGSGIFDHVDQAVFGDTVISLSLGSTCVMRFTRDERSEELLLEPRSIVVLSGDARSKWKHGIPARTADLWNGRELVRSRRVSLTFRAVPVS